MITLKRKFVISCVILTAFTAICSSVFAENDRGRTAMKPRAKSAEMHRHVEMLLDQIEQESPEEARLLRELKEENPEAFRQKIAEYIHSDDGIFDDFHAQRPKTARKGDKKQIPDKEAEMKGMRQHFEQKHEEFTSWLKENYPDEYNKYSKSKDGSEPGRDH